MVKKILVCLKKINLLEKEKLERKPETKKVARLMSQDITLVFRLQNQKHLLNLQNSLLHLTQNSHLQIPPFLKN